MIAGMKNLRTTRQALCWLIMATLLSGACAQSVGYADQIGAYKNDARPIDGGPTNSSFIANLAVSQAKRAVNGSGVGSSSAGGNFTSLVTGNSNQNSDIASAGGFNFASPVITGSVRGNVTVVVQKGAVKGNITAVQP